MSLGTLLLGFGLIAGELELLGGPGYEMAKRNLDMLDSLILNEATRRYHS